MDELENKTPIEAQPEANDLQSQVDDLRQLVGSLMILLLVVSGALNLFLLRQWRFAKSDLDRMRPEVTQIVNDFNKNSTVLGDFVKKLSDYSKSHSDFSPIATKYRLNEAQAKPAGAAAPAAQNKK